MMVKAVAINITQNYVNKFTLNLTFIFHECIFQDFFGHRIQKDHSML